jgi:hypothetical protein
MFTWNVWVPRVGFNLKLAEDGKTVLRGSYGRAYQPIFLDDFRIVHPGISRTTLARWNPATSSYSTIISVTDPLANIAVDRDLKSPYTDSYSVGVDRELAPNFGVGVSYVYKRSEDLIGWRDVGGVYGTRNDVLPDGRTVTVFPLLNATSQRRFLRTNGEGTYTRYHGVVLTADKRWSQRWLANAAYTYSRAEGLATTGQDPNSDVNGGGRLTLDRPHMFFATMAYEVPRIDGQLSVNYMGVSGTAFAPQALIQLPQGRLAVNIEPAGGYRRANQHLLSFRFSKVVLRFGERRLEVAAQMNNATNNQANQGIVTATYFSDTFGQPQNWIEPRRLFFQTRFAF